jgi:putative ABC transport system permease protein
VAEAGYPETTYEIVGVVGNTKYADLREEMPPIAFVPMAQNPGLQPWAPVIVRSNGRGSGITTAIAQRVKVLNPTAAVQFIDLKTQISERLVADRTTAWLAGAFGVLAIAMATVGLYGIIAYLAVSRRQEIGIRLSLGSTRGQIVRLVLGDSFWPLAAGVLIGLPLAAVAMRAAGTLLFGLSPTDPPTLFGAAALLAVAGAVAGAVPAWRAARVDPGIALRCD